MLHFGRLIAEGTPDEIRANVDVQKALLGIEALQTFYGKSHVLRDVSFTVPAGGITVLLGRNGAGKTTTLRSIMGLTPPRAGTVRFKGREITGQPPHRVFRLGVGYVPEGRQIFPHLDVGENLLALSRALMSNPRVLLMDQLSEGLAPQIAAEVMTTIRLRCRTCRSRSRGYGSEGAARTRFCARRVA